MPKNTTIRDVAQQAGVSRQTVSRAINNQSGISVETRKRVLQVARDLGYRPSSIARGLKTNRTATLGLIVPDIANPFFAEVARGASEVAYGVGYSVLLCNTDEQPDREWSLLRTLEAHHVDGIVLISSRLSDEMLTELGDSACPLVLVNRAQAPREHLGCILVDDYTGAVQSVEHLVSRGHRRIGFLGGTPESRSSQERLRGYRDALAQAGIQLDPHWNLYCAPTVTGGREAAERLLVEQPQLDALLAYNDLVAVGALQACEALGRPAPQGCALVGWDDIVFSSYVSPPLTTMRMPRYQMGERAMSLLLDLIDPPGHLSETIMLQAELVVRGST